MIPRPHPHEPRVSGCCLLSGPLLEFRTVPGRLTWISTAGPSGSPLYFSSRLTHHLIIISLILQRCDMFLGVSMQHSLDTVQKEVQKFSLDICLPRGRKSCGCFLLCDLKDSLAGFSFLFFSCSLALVSTSIIIWFQVIEANSV